MRDAKWQLFSNNDPYTYSSAILLPFSSLIKRPLIHHTLPPSKRTTPAEEG